MKEIAIAPPHKNELPIYKTWLTKRKFNFKVLKENEKLTSDNLLLLCGGADLGKRPERDKQETEWIRQALELNIPIVGICRGLQLINVYLGGSLIEDIDSSLKHYTKRDEIMFEHKLPTPSAMHKLKVGEQYEMINSRHHQAIDKLGKGIVPTLFADDGIIEAAIVEDREIFLVQWHPEREEVFDTWAEKFVSTWVHKKLTL
ncbi:MAG TPA: gamma-glutamyl-gamma-aminobutyrate hydrolase family protein [Bacteroidales bacterium]|nr:gamma-glutamyl-gamma-aminobutyrate hydrolase family protein [Bacteroidales bacterium]